ncbi:MAG: SDR family NAD(P)-dependent oxidoreductase [Chloroflexi bacterium]|nr:SDR family NAD(P)-dependent oxidoreductase [Chloroflexota bacterium]
MTENIAGKKVLVTGAGGFIGSHLTEQLVRCGANVRAFVRYNSRADPGLLRQAAPEMRREIEIVAGDLRDSSAVQKAVEDVELVFHLGALISIPYSYHHPREVVETNVIGTFNVLMACLDKGISRLIHTSTSEVYGTALRVPIDEEHPLQGQSPYSASKIGADKLVESFFRAYDLPVVTVRPFNTYGPRQSARAVIPTIITQALTQDEIYLGAMDTRRDFTFVSDTVSGFIRAAQAGSSIEGQTFNLGTGTEVTIGEVAQKILEIINRPVRILNDPQRMRPGKSEVMRLVSDNRLAGEALGWQPEVSLDDGLRQTIAWIHQHLDDYRIGVYEL